MDHVPSGGAAVTSPYDPPTLEVVITMDDRVTAAIDTYPGGEPHMVITAGSAVIVFRPGDRATPDEVRRAFSWIRKAASECIGAMPDSTTEPMPT